MNCNYIKKIFGKRSCYLLNHRSVRVVLFAVVLIGYINISGCDPRFDPLEDNDDYHFTMFGAFDLSQDTQWVRVMPVMDSLVSTSKAPIGAEVILTHISTGEKIMLNDSLFAFREGEFYAWNFWMDTPLQENGKYTITAETPDGRFSRAEFNIPPDFGIPIVVFGERDQTGYVFGSGVERLVVASSIYFVRVLRFNRVLQKMDTLPVQEVELSNLDRVQYYGNDYEFQIDDINRLDSRFRDEDGYVIVGKEILVASGTEIWPDFTGLFNFEYALPNLHSNVENGLGVVSGIVSKRVPMESCYDGAGELEPCPLIKPPY